MSEINLYFEEYKLLKEEAKSYTDVNFKELQFILTLVAAFVAVASFNLSSNLRSFWGLMIVQFIIYLFLLIQASRITYILSLRTHLANLEDILNKQCDTKLQWESKIVPKKIATRSSLNYKTQIMVSCAYIISFLTLAIYSMKEILIDKGWWLYLLLLLVEGLTLGYCAWKIYREGFYSEPMNSQIK